MIFFFNVSTNGKKTVSNNYNYRKIKSRFQGKQFFNNPLLK